MRILLLTLGTRGDLELFLLLAGTLRTRGHQPHLVTSAFHACHIPSGLSHTSIGSPSADPLNHLLASLQNTTDLRQRTLAYVSRFLRPELAAATPALQTLAADADYFISNLKITLTRNAEILPTPFVTYDPPAAPGELDLYSANLPRERILELVAFPHDFIDPRQTWPHRFRFTNFWLRADPPIPRLSLPTDLQAYLTSGPPPVILTPGSMRMFDPNQLAATFSEALRATNQRGLFLAPPGTALQAPHVRLETRFIPYADLFSHAACVIHHGGTGTVGETLRAGKPSILMPQILAQRHMADLLIDHTLAPAAFDPATLTTADLATAIQAATTDPRYSQSAAR